MLRKDCVIGKYVPELPEVETTRLGLLPHWVGRNIRKVVLRRLDLRWPIPDEVAQCLRGAQVTGLSRRAKYLRIHTYAGTCIVHLGMSGSLTVVPAEQPPRVHDHVDWVLDSGIAIRLHDPRRFGSVLWEAPNSVHPLLRELGPEPLSPDFSAAYLYARSRSRKAPVKAFLMDQSVVVGVGNIYAAESLFGAGVSPLRAAGKVSMAGYTAIETRIRGILSAAIARGGTTLRDYQAPDHGLGAYGAELLVYGRGGQPCRRCSHVLRSVTIAQRASVYCATCQR
jgi:formamidopyrimidine-DNA glycosylase